MNNQNPEQAGQRPMTRRERLAQRMATGEFQQLDPNAFPPAPNSPVQVTVAEPPLPPAPPASNVPPTSSVPPAPTTAPNSYVPAPSEIPGAPGQTLPPNTSQAGPSWLPPQGVAPQGAAALGATAQGATTQASASAGAPNLAPQFPPGPQIQPAQQVHHSGQVPRPAARSIYTSGPIPNLSGPVPRLDPNTQRERERQRKQKQRRAFLAIVMSLLLVSGGGYFVIKNLAVDSTTKNAVDQVGDYPGPGEETVEIIIPQGATGRQMGQILFEVDSVASIQAFVNAFNANVNAASIQPGSYEVQTKMRAADVVALLIASTTRTDKAITIPEGLTIGEITAKLSSVLNISTEEIDAVLADPQSYGLPEQAKGNPEGWLFGAQYNFPPGTTAQDALRQMVNQTVRILKDRKVPEDQWQTVLTKASLVEREGKRKEDRKKIAQAIDNRLKHPMPLQIDASLAYGLNKPGTQLTIADKKIDNPYNLEINRGLPPTPIAGPSAESIDAVLNPEPGPWLFWVSVNLNTGETKFAVTYADHQVNVAELRAWQKENGLR